MMKVLQFWVVALISIGVSLAYPIADDESTDEEVRQLQYYRQDPTGGVLGAIGTALVPVIGAILGPILTNLATGISTAFNNGLNNQGTTTTTTTTVRPTTTSSRNPSRDQFGFGITPLEGGQPGFVVRVPGQDSPFYLLPHPPPSDNDGLPAVGPHSGFGGKLNVNDGIIEGDDSIIVDAVDELTGNDPGKAEIAQVKKPLLKAHTETEYHRK